MKTLITAGLAALTLVGGTVATGAAAQAQPHYGPPAQTQSYGHNGYNGYGAGYGNGNGYGNGYGQGGFHQVQPRYGRGQFLPQSYRGRDRFVDYRRNHLRAPPRGYGWVQGNSNEYLMIALTTGLIAAIANSH